MSDKPWTETDTDRAEQDIEAYGAIMAPEGTRIIAEVKRLTDALAAANARAEQGIRDGLKKAAVATRGVSLAVKAATDDTNITAMFEGLAKAFEDEANGG